MTSSYYCSLIASYRNSAAYFFKKFGITNEIFDIILRRLYLVGILKAVYQFC